MEIMNELIKKVGDGEKTSFLLDGITRFGWSSGFLVEHDGRWYLLDEEGEGAKLLPSFVRGREDAKEYIKTADGWYVDGVEDGRIQKAREIRKAIDGA